jgi:hypothetical protein
MATSGFPTAGFSTKEFMRIEHRWSKPLSVAHLAEGYQRIIDGARISLGLPMNMPVVLTGWSRGASLAVLVSTSHEGDPWTRGIVAIGLAAHEQLDIEGDSDDTGGCDTDAATTLDQLPPGSIPMYPLLARLAPRRLVVIQASKDGYLPARRARQLFGPDSDTARLVTIDARNHRFSGGEPMFATALVEAVRWVSQEDAAK